MRPTSYVSYCRPRIARRGSCRRDRSASCAIARDDFLIAHYAGRARSSIRKYRAPRNHLPACYWNASRPTLPSRRASNPSARPQASAAASKRRTPPGGSRPRRLAGSRSRAFLPRMAAGALGAPLRRRGRRHQRPGCAARARKYVRAGAPATAAGYRLASHRPAPHLHAGGQSFLDLCAARAARPRRRSRRRPHRRHDCTSASRNSPLTPAWSSSMARAPCPSPARSTASWWTRPAPAPALGRNPESNGGLPRDLADLQTARRRCSPTRSPCWRPAAGWSTQPARSSPRRMSRWSHRRFTLPAAAKPAACSVFRDASPGTVSTPL
jgi:hypothetical protein